MHELSIALNILDIAAEEAERNGGGSRQGDPCPFGPPIRRGKGGARVGI